MLGGALLAAVAQQPADAHLVSTQLGPFYDGAAHALAGPEDLLSIVAVALLAGLGGAKHGRTALVALAGGWALGAAAALAPATPAAGAAVPLIGAGTLLVLGIAGAADLRVAPPLLGVVAAAVGASRGLLGGAGEAGGTWVTALGAATGAFVLAAVLLALAVWLAERRARIALRVGGSWLAAIGMLMVGWQIHAAR